jgi:site-specific DNA recombinase
MRVAVYVRVSTLRQAQTQTIEEQLERLRAHIETQGWMLPEDHIFRDDGYSGATLNRPALDRLRDKVRAAEIERVLLTAPDRLARNYVHQMVLLEEMERWGCEVEFLDHPMGRDPHDQLLLQIRGAVAEYERTLIAERMRRGRQRKLRAGGLLPWTRLPYGYRTDPDRPRDPAGVRLESAEAAVVAELFARYSEEDVSLMKLALGLSAQGTPTPRGHWRWNQTTLRGILSNPTYTGQVYVGRTRARPARVRRSATHPLGYPHSGHACTPPEEWVPVATVPAVVSREQFDRVQAKLAHNQAFARRHHTAHDYLLRARVSCGVCPLACMGRALSPTYRYDVCRGKANPVASCRDEKCHARFIPAGQLDALVWQDLCELLTHPESIAQAMERAQGGHWLPQALQARRENLRRGRMSLEQQLERLTEAYPRQRDPAARVSAPAPGARSEGPSPGAPG